MHAVSTHLGPIPYPPFSVLSLPTTRLFWRSAKTVDAGIAAMPSPSLKCLSLYLRNTSAVRAASRYLLVSVTSCQPTSPCFVTQDRLHATGRESLLDEVEFELLLAPPEPKQSRHLYIQVG
jgi:hypothetical protein